MIYLKGYDDVPAVLPGEFTRLPAGGYVCRVICAEVTKSKAGQPMLVLNLDIHEGEYQGYFFDSAQRVKNFRLDFKWDNAATYRQLIFDKNGLTSRFFKGLLTCFQKSNPSLKIEPQMFDAAVLNNRLIGFIFAEEEYEKQDGSVGTRVFAKFPKYVEDIRDGKFTLLPVKKLSVNNGGDSSPATFDVPF